MEIATFELEKILAENGYDLIIGTDEVGRGPLCGPVVAAAVVIKNSALLSELNSDSELSSDASKMWDLVRDSKKLSEKQREKVFDFIHEHFHVGIGLCDHETIDRINILEASFLSMKKAVQELLRLSELKPLNSQNTPKTIVLVDGNKEVPNFSFEQQAVIGGDRLSKSIAAASIVAKVTRDRMMREFGKKYPGYGMEKHMGYGTKEHMDALAKLGPCEIHRKSFGPVRKCLNEAASYGGRL
ncbi:MAG TPA: ribonuclease HII [Patescibacteria group bacterium]